MADISKIKIPNVSTPYNIVDAGAERVSNKVTSISSSSNDTQYPSAKAVYTAISSLPTPMVFKGTLGTGGTITSLPTASSSNEGFTYKVITAGTYAGQSAKVGDVFVSNGSAWVLIPAGDVDTDTWRNLKVNGTDWLGNAISTGGANFKAGSNITLTTSGNDLTITSTATSDNQTIKGNGTAFGSNDAINLVPGSNVTITPDTTNKKITISSTDTNTHYTTHLYAGSGGAANATTTNGNTKLTVTDDSTVRNSVTLKGTGATTVVSDASGNVTINSTNTTYSDMTAATSSAAGTHGLVPAPASGKQDSFLRGNATWANASDIINTLSTGSSTPTDNDYYVSQYASGGTTTTTYHRRPMSALWTYIKAKGEAAWAGVSKVGTITGITMNGASKGTSGVVNLGTVITSHQDISGKMDKSIGTTAGDIVYWSAASTPTRLGKGSNGQVLTTVSGVPSWADAPMGTAHIL